MMNQLVDPREQQVRLVPPVPLQGRAGFGLVLFEAAAIVRHLQGRKGGHGKVVAVAAIGIEGVA
jgi:hypothetical protein